MTFLPIVERELRVAARRPGTYLTRSASGLGALIVGGIAALVAVANPTLRFGPVFFESLSAVALAYCLAAGRFLTADCLSSEKREDTMGLLFLTDLKGYDVVLGKMAATSLNGLYGLLAVMPVLALTVLTGGVTNGEFWRVVLVLLETFLFSLAIGMFASALTREFKSAIALNFYLLLALAGLLPAVAGLRFFMAPASTLDQAFFLPCPVYGLFLAFDLSYAKQAAQFWTSAEIILLISLLLVGLTCRIAPTSWQAKSPVAPKKTLRRQVAFGAQTRVFRRQLLDENAYYWLAARPWWKGRVAWAVLAVALFWLISMVFSTGWLDEAICVAVAVVLNTTFKLWITIEAGQILAADVKSGAFELLLATPLSPRDIVRGQWLALRRQFLKPLIFLVVVELFFMAKLMGGRATDRGFWFSLWMAGILMLAADLVTLSLVAMETALTEKNFTRASLKAAGRVLVKPWGFWFLVVALRQAWGFMGDAEAGLNWKFNLGWWFVIALGIDIVSSVRAWRRLTGNFRDMALRQFGPPPMSASWRARLVKMGRIIQERVWRHPRNRKWALRLATLLVVVISLGAWQNNRSRHPAPEVYLTAPHAGKTLVAVPLYGDSFYRNGVSSSVYLILPDGSLWSWGVTQGGHHAALPYRIGTNCDWTMISVRGGQRLGVRRDGTLWQWQDDGRLFQVGHDTDWMEAVGVGVGYQVARKKDGTLWETGRPGFARGRTGIPTPVDTNRDWVAVESTDSAVMALRANGTLWGWGVFPNIGAIPAPIQLCSETNWISFGENLGMPTLENKAGERWYLTIPGNTWPGPAVSINSIGMLAARSSSGATPTPSTSLFSPWSAQFAVHPDGTLWNSVTEYNSGGLPGLILPAQQVGSRTDWVAVANARIASFGLTADGTLWTWGWNLGEAPKVQTRTRIQAAGLMIQAAFLRKSVPPGGFLSHAATYEMEQKPRVLMRLVEEKPK